MSSARSESARVAHDVKVECPHARECPGCPLLGHALDEQLAIKRARVIDSLAPYEALRALPVAEIAAPTTVERYRGRAKLIVETSPSSTKIGLFVSGTSHDVVDLPGCRVLAPELVATAAKLRAALSGSPRVAALVRAVDLRSCVAIDATPRVLVTLVADREDVSHGDDLARARAFAVALSTDEDPSATIAGVALNLRPRASRQLLGDELIALAGVRELPDAIDGIEHLATFGAFVQAHRAQAAVAHRAIATGLAVSAGEHVLDLFGGSGAIGLALAARGARVTVVESFAPAAERASRAAGRLGAASGALSSRAGDVEQVLRAEATGAFRDAVAAVVNPPRRGLSPSIRRSLARLPIARLAYLSCDTDTLSRDLDHLATLGFRAESLAPFDMIPLTDHVETLAILRRADACAPRVLHRETGFVIGARRPHESTTPDDHYPTSVVETDVGCSGVAVWCRAPADRATWSEALSIATSEYVALVKGVTAPKITLRKARATVEKRAAVEGHSLVKISANGCDAATIGRALSAVGHPIVGDPRDGHAPTNRLFLERHTLDRAFLHRARLTVTPPGGGATRDLRSELAGDLRTVLRRLRCSVGMEQILS